MKAIIFKSLIQIVLTALISGCVGNVNKVNADKYYDAALQAEWAADYAQAKEMYFRSFVNARSGGATKAYISATLYGYGRMQGYTCEYQQADETLKESLKLEREVSSTVTPNITKRLSELGRLNLAIGNFVQASNYLGEAAPLLEQLGMLASDPNGYALYLLDYAKALELSGNDALAKSVRLKAKNIQSANTGIKAKFQPVYYSDVCNKS